MGLIEQLNKIERLDNLIRRKGTGSPSNLADKLNLSERQVYNIINYMKNLGAPIYFCHHNNSYCYEYEVKAHFGFYNNQMKKIGGGKTIYFNRLIELKNYFSDVIYI